jgi:hypothetical protein
VLMLVLSFTDPDTLEEAVSRSIWDRETCG